MDDEDSDSETGYLILNLITMVFLAVELYLKNYTL